jgi:hypothetical protein
MAILPSFPTILSIYWATEGTSRAQLTLACWDLSMGGRHISLKLPLCPPKHLAKIRSIARLSEAALAAGTEPQLAEELLQYVGKGRGGNQREKRRLTPRTSGERGEKVDTTHARTKKNREVRETRTRQ